MSAHESLLDSWGRFINHQDIELGRTLCAADIVVHAFEEGAGGPESLYEGFEALAGWVLRPAKGDFQLDVQSFETVEPHPEMPPCDVTIRAPFVIRIMTGEWYGWTNNGVWHFAVTGGVITAVMHEPRPPTAEHYINPTMERGGEGYPG